MSFFKHTCLTRPLFFIFKLKYMGNFKPRGWQLEAMKVVKTKIYKSFESKALIVAGVGAGKTIFSQMVFNDVFKENLFKDVVIISPTENIKYTWASGFEKDFDIPVDFKYDFKYHYNQDYKGVSITYKSIESLKNAEKLANRINSKTFVIIDEVHHAGDNKSWGEALLRIGENAGFILLLSGTPTRSDNSKIPFVQYKPEGEYWRLVSDYEYTYADSVRDNVCCPVKFERQKSNFETEFGTKKTLKYSDELQEDKKKLAMLLKVPLVSEVPTFEQIDIAKKSFIYKSWIKANEKLNQINDSTNQNKAGLVICDKIEYAKNLYNLLCSIYGSDFVELVSSDDKDSSKKINNFRDSNKSWLISVDMVSEGVDIPRIRVIQYATRKATMLYFMQVLGRGVRNPDQYNNYIDCCHMFIPDFKLFVENAESVEESIRHIVEEMQKTKEVRRGKNNKEKTYKDLFGDDVVYATSEEAGIVFKGDRISNEQKHYAEKIAKQHNTTTETVLSISKAMKGNLKVEQNPKRAFVSMTEKKKLLRERIQREVSKIERVTKMDYKDIHYLLNQKIGKKTNEQTHEELKRKLELAKKMYWNYDS